MSHTVDMPVSTPLTENALKVIGKRYLKKDLAGKIIETPDQMFRRVARTLAGAELDKKEFWEDQFYAVMSQLEFLPNSPAFTGAGSNLGNLSACFVLPVPDNMDGILKTMADAALIHKSGGGVGYNFSDLRPSDDPVSSTWGVSSGPISFMFAYNHVTEAIKQGGTRRGANMGLLACDHPNIEQFITCKNEDGKLSNFNISVVISDKFMNSVKNNEQWDLINPRTKKVDKTVSAKELFDKIIYQAWKNGEPGLFFLDTTNKFNPTPELGQLRITNPCYAKGSLVATARGLVPVEDLKVGDRAYVGKGNFETIIKHFDVGERGVLRITTNSGYENVVTPDQEMWVKGKGIVLAKDLKVGDELEIQEDGFLPPGGNRKWGQLAGLIAGDGCVIEDRVVVSYNPRDRAVATTFGELFGKLSHSTSLSLYEPTQRSGKTVLRHQTGRVEILEFAQKYIGKFSEQVTYKQRIPLSVLQGGRGFLRGWVEGLFFADGHIEASGSNMTFALTNKSHSFMQDIRTLLLQFGIQTSLYECTTIGGYQPNSKYFRLQVLGSKSRVKFVKEFELLSSYMRSQFKMPKHPQNRIYSHVVKEIRTVGISSVYDFTTDGTRLVYVDGIRSRECGEVPLLPYESCVLGSINVVKFVNLKTLKIDFDRLKPVVEIATRALDNIIDSNTYGFHTEWSDVGQRIAEATKRTRKIGLGVMGFADMLIKMQVPYTSEKALEIAEELMKFINDTAFEYSKRLGEEKGSFPAIEQSIYKGIKLRNSIRTVIAPTGTISIMANSTSSGIEPVIFFELVRNQAGMKMTEKHWALEELIEKNRGYATVFPKWFVGSKDVPTEQHIKIQAAFQKHTNNAVSKTINMPSTATEDDVRKAYFLAWELGCKGITVYRDGSRYGQVLSSGTEKKIEKFDHQNESSRPAVEFPGHTHGTRPDILPAEVERITTAFGKMYVTVSLKDNKPFEVFVQVGKGGFDIMANAEALGRLISLSLRNGGSVDEVYDQLRNIGGSSVVFDRGNKITSVPDAISKVLAKYIKGTSADVKLTFDASKVPITGNGKFVDYCSTSDCPGTLRFEGRCYTCDTCGQSKC